MKWVTGGRYAPGVRGDPISGTDGFAFLLDNKYCRINASLFVRRVAMVQKDYLTGGVSFSRKGQEAARSVAINF
jgi:hypothetical protein